jgi:hypothetical protein
LMHPLIRFRVIGSPRCGVYHHVIDVRIAEWDIDKARTPRLPSRAHKPYLLAIAGGPQICYSFVYE